MNHPTWHVPWNSSLIERYDIHAPRYTSYPTALQFTGLTSDQVTAHLQAGRHNNDPLSLYVHIPFCEKICFYCACNRVATKDKTRADRYLDALEREMALFAKYVGHRRVTQLHLGGGTPTFLNTQQMTRLLDLLSIYFDAEPTHLGEYSIELDPRHVSSDMLALLHGRGFSRVSFGIQDFNERTQIAINRRQPFELVKTKTDLVRALGFNSINFDLIYGLPFQNLANIRQSWDQALSLKPDRISLYNYAHLPERFKPQRRITSDTLPSAQEKLDILQASIERLQSEGYVYIGMDHFALPTDELAQALEKGTLQRNFQGYSTQAQTDMVALGCSAISQINGLYVQNQHDIDAYENTLVNAQFASYKGVFLTEDDKIRQWVIGQLACQGYLCFEELSQRFSINGASYFAEERTKLKALAMDGLVALTPTNVQVTALGRLLLRAILVIFDAYAQQESATRYSKVL